VIEGRNANNAAADYHDTCLIFHRRLSR